MRADRRDGDDVACALALEVGEGGGDAVRQRGESEQAIGLEKGMPAVLMLRY